VILDEIAYTRRRFKTISEFRRTGMPIHLLRRSDDRRLDPAFGTSLRPPPPSHRFRLPKHDRVSLRPQLGNWRS
jgi:hypothetical protein